MQASAGMYMLRARGSIREEAACRLQLWHCWPLTYLDIYESPIEAYSCSMVSACPGSTYEREHILDRIYLFQVWILEETEASDAKHRVEDVNHVARPVCKAAQLWILPR